MSKEERNVVFSVFQHACPAELRDNVHISLDLLRRVSGQSITKIIHLLGGLGSLGFRTELRSHDPHADSDRQDQVLVLEWHDMSVDAEAIGNATLEAEQMIECATDGYCEEHSLDKLRLLDFSQLSSATHEMDEHEKSTKA